MRILYTVKDNESTSFTEQYAEKVLSNAGNARIYIYIYIEFYNHHHVK